MGYFSSFPTITYQFKGDPYARSVTDICKRVKVRDQIITAASLYNLYLIRDGESADVLAAKYYGNSEYHWILLMTNKVLDPMFEWPMHSQVLEKFISNKYPGGTRYDVHHYELVSPFEWRNGMYMPHDVLFADYGADLYDSDTEEILPVTNEEYEERQNDLRRRLHIFKKELVNQFITEFSTMIAK